MNSPFEARVPAVFVSVTDMRRSIAWYCRLLGQPIPEQPAADLYGFRLGNGGANLFLQRAERVVASPHVLFSLPAAPIEQAYDFLQEYGIEVVAFDQGADGSAIQFKDPDGNILMACDI